MKSLLIKTHKDGDDPYEAILEQRNTPRQDTGLMMFNRKTLSKHLAVTQRTLS